MRPLEWQGFVQRAELRWQSSLFRPQLGMLYQTNNYFTLEMETRFSSRQICVKSSVSTSLALFSGFTECLTPFTSNHCTFFRPNTTCLQIQEAPLGELFRFSLPLRNYEGYWVQGWVCRPSRYMEFKVIRNSGEGVCISSQSSGCLYGKEGSLSVCLKVH